MTKRAGLNELIAEARREAQMRMRVYEYRVQQGKMDASTAARQIKLMDEIGNVLETLLERLPLFKQLAQLKEVRQQHPDAQHVLDALPSPDVPAPDQKELL